MFPDGGVWRRADSAAVKVLVVDDSHEQRALFAALMRSAGHETVEVGSGEAALMIATDNPDGFGLVLMDAHMPGGIDGAETTRRLRAMGGAWADLPIIAMSATAIANWHEAGATTFFDKALGSAALLRLLNAPPVSAAAEDEKTGWLVPRSLMWTAAMAVPALVAGGSWYMATQGSKSDELGKAMMQARGELNAQQIRQNDAIHNNEMAIEKLRAERNEIINAMDQRMTRVEAQIADDRDRRQKIESQLQFLADSLRARK
jgi:CheY-like chemotaxis protein